MATESVVGLLTILRDSGSTLFLGRGADAVRLVWNRR